MCVDEIITWLCQTDVMEPARGWQLGKSVLQCNLHMLDQKLACDVRIVITSGGMRTEISAHKYVLISRSPVFEAMFCGEFNEASSTVIIPDVEPESFSQMLRYMYAQESTITPTNVLPMLFAAKKYMIEGLVDSCISFLRENISRANVCIILNHCIMYDEQDLIQRCLRYIGPRANDILKSDTFQDLSKPALLCVVKYDRLVVDSENDVLTVCKQWARSQITNETDTDQHRDSDTVSDKEIREELGECLYHIRFATMTVEELAVAVGSSQILSDEETRVLFCHLSTWQYHETLKDMKFNVNPRLTTYDCCRRFWQVGSGWNYDRGLTDAISFRVDRPIWLMGVSLYGGETAGDDHDYVLELHNGTCHKWLTKCQGSFETDGTDNPIPVLLKMPQRLEPNSVHTVRILINGPKTYFGERGLRTIRHEGVKFTFLSSSESMNETVVAGGQIPELIFRRI